MPEREPMTFTAKYPGRCANCDDNIIPGDDITYHGDDELIHTQCDTDPTPKTTEPCKQCWCAHEGECW